MVSDPSPPRFKAYAALSKLPGLRGYIAKLGAVAFLGIHLPLLSLAAFLALNQVAMAMYWPVFLLVLAATLVGTVATVYAIWQLLQPVVETSEALQRFYQRGELPQLPTSHLDLVGQLMSNTMSCTHQLHAALELLTTHDPATGAWNRLGLMMQWPQLVTAAATAKAAVLICYLDIQRFSAVNALYGRPVGDQALRQVAERLRSAAGRQGLVARLGSDEFAIALVNSAEGTESVIQKLRQQVSLPIVTAAAPLRLSAQIGVARFPVDGTQLEALLSKAEIALQQTQHSDQGFQVYSVSANLRVQDRLRLESDLAVALEQQQLTLYYQPRVSLRTSRIVGVEALVRWHNPRLGWVAPDQFIPMAEAMGLIHAMGEWILETACRQHSRWVAAGLEPINLSVNLSARQLQQADLVDRIDQILHRTQVAAPYLELEITETFYLQDIAAAQAVLRALHGLGIRLALDDFGTGYSSLSYLRQLPFDVLKLDRVFTQEVPEKATIAQLIVALAQALDLKLVVEGIETRSQCDFFRAANCHEGQGHYFYPAMTPTQLARSLRSGAVSQESC